MPICDENTIRKYLKKNIPEFIIKKSLDSTNTYLKKLSMENSAIQNHTVVIADTQLCGRGRTGNSFFSPSGGLYMSILLNPDTIYPDLGLITALSAVSVCRAIEKVTDKSPKIKWVNDIYLGKKKICGILTESSIAPDGTIKNIILGVGLNIVFSGDELPQDIRYKAGALFDKKEEPIDIKSILCAEILNSLFEILSDENSAGYIEEYKIRCLLLGKRISYKKNGTEYEGIAENIDDSLHLIVKNEDGGEIVLSSGEIKITDWENN